MVVAVQVEGGGAAVVERGPAPATPAHGSSGIVLLLVRPGALLQGAVGGAGGAGGGHGGHGGGGRYHARVRGLHGLQLHPAADGGWRRHQLAGVLLLLLLLLLRVLWWAVKADGAVILQHVHGVQARLLLLLLEESHGCPSTAAGRGTMSVVAAGVVAAAGRAAGTAAVAAAHRVEALVANRHLARDGKARRGHRDGADGAVMEEVRGRSNRAGTEGE